MSNPTSKFGVFGEQPENYESVFRKDLFKNKVALITGGATGIGYAIAEQLATKLSCKVIIASRKEHRLKESRDKIRSKGGICDYVTLNLRDYNSIKLCVKNSLKIHGHINYLVNNAGGQFTSFSQNVSYNGLLAVIQLNLIGTYLMSQTVFKECFKKQRHGNIVNITANFFNGMPGASHSGAAKAGIDNITKSFAQEWSLYNVRVNSVAPGVIKSSGLDTYHVWVKALFKAIAKENYMYRYGTTQECANAVIFLLSDASSFITGQCIKVDGGLSIYHPLLKPVKHLESKKFDYRNEKNKKSKL